MKSNGDIYLKRFYELLKYLPEDERLDAVKEIKSNIEEGVAHGQSEETILTRLGDPHKLAIAYQSEYMVENSSKSIKNFFSMLKFYSTTGLMSIMIIPVLATIAYGFGFCAVLTLIAGVLRTFGASWVNMNLGSGYEVPIAWSIPYSIVLSAIIGGIALISHKYLKKYLTSISEKYKKLIPNKF